MMKKITLFILLTVFAVQFGSAQIVKNFDANATWNGYMAWTGPSGDGGGVWTVADLVALVDTGANTATLKPNRVNDTGSYWFTNPTDLFGEKTMTASFYIEDPSLITTNFNFVGNISAFNLDGAYAVTAFIKILSAGYASELLVVSQTITGTGDFTVNYDGTQAGAAIVQYGISVVGANVNPGAAYDAQYDALGSVVATSQALSVEDNNFAKFMSYPNPTQDSWTVKTKNIKMSTIQVFDILGKQVLSLAPNAIEANIDASGLKSGLYFAKINTDNGSSSLKLVRQ
jgi:hypothetical protein